MSLESKRRVYVWVEGVGNLGAFTSRSGGNADSEEVKDRSAGGEQQEALGGTPTTENVTVARRFVPTRDVPLIRQLRPLRGRRDALVTDQPLDRDDNPVGPADRYPGIFKSVNPSDADANSNDVARFEIEVSTHSTVH
jgi:hypothetical protein